MDKEEHTPPFPMSLLVKVWITMLILTTLSVSVSYLNMHQVAVFTQLLIATVKASLVLAIYMRIRYERPMFFYMILAALVTYVIFVVLTFADYWYR